MIKCVFHKGKLNAIDTVHEKQILSFSRPVFWWDSSQHSFIHNFVLIRKAFVYLKSCSSSNVAVMSYKIMGKYAYH